MPNGMHTPVEFPKGSSPRNSTPVKHDARFTWQARQARKSSINALGTLKYDVGQSPINLEIIFFFLRLKIKYYVRPLYLRDAIPSGVSRRSAPPNSRMLAFIINGRYGYYSEGRLIYENRGERECDK